MFKIIVFLIFCVTATFGTSTSKPVYCGDTPDKLLSCLKNPHVVSQDVISSCNNDQITECDVMTCAFRKYKWLKAGKIDKPKVVSHFNQLAKDKPEWKTVLEYAITNCVERDLPPQGVYLGCPGYDILHCVLVSFIKKTDAAQWDSSPSCEYPRQYAGACPVCPSDCFAPAIPYGSCNACYAVAPAA
ncbi:unnamed protein product [Arctia plantaginis]|uniref:Uncharacterized protein n=1 Tax=Arctia plantaginis TaxID=874455 RepID=A0A8S1B823_ARCPL|nr:unnamed protein product [Arctia plantaginis]